MKPYNSTYFQIKLPTFIPSISIHSIKVLGLSKLLPYVIDAVRISKYNSIMLSVYDLLHEDLLLEYGRKILDQKKNIHQCFNFDKNTIVFLDSGSFESMRKEGCLRDTSLDVYKFQKDAGADVWIILDYITEPNIGIEENKRRINQTINFAKEINQIHNLPISLMAVAHGYDQDSLIKCVKELAKLENVQIIAIPILAEPFGGDAMIKFKTVLQVRKEINQINPNKGLHLLACGKMRLWPLYVLCGANSMDATSWITNKADPQRLTWVQRSKRSVDVNCNCKICKRFPGNTVEEVCQMGPVFTLQHNLFFVEQVMDEIRKRLNKGTLDEYAERCAPRLYFKIEKEIASRSGCKYGWRGYQEIQKKTST